MDNIDSATWEGVQSLLDNYAKLQEDDFVVVLYTSDSSESAAWISAALELRGVPARRVWMAPLHDDGFGERLAPALPPAADLKGRLVVLSFERNTMSHTRALEVALAPYQKSQVLRAIGACPGLFSTALRIPPEELAARNTALLERLTTARRLRIETAGGTDLSVTLDSGRLWVSNCGLGRPGGVVILPAGEVATLPASISGVFVADLAFNVNAITSRDSRLHDHPVTVRIEDGRAVRYECTDPAVSRFLQECFQAHCAYSVRELGFGTNTAVTDATAMNSRINERRPGVHLGFGNNQDPGDVSDRRSVHLNLIARGAKVWVDDAAVPLDLDDIDLSSLFHSDASRKEEDAFLLRTQTEELEIDDCCGILTNDGGVQLFSRSGPVRRNLWTRYAAALADAYVRATNTIRFELVTRELLMHMPPCPQRIVDVGGGFGLQAVLLARAGHRVVVVDFDEKMLTIARDKLSSEPREVSSRVELVYGDGREAARLVGTGFDLVCCHSVLTYEEDFAPMLSGLVGLVREGGLVSVLCINRESYAMRSGLQGRWREAAAILESRELDGPYVPTRQHTRAEVVEVLESSGARVRDWQGIGVFTDHLTKWAGEEDLGEVCQVEWLASHRDPYRQVARCFHMIAERL